MRILMLLLVPWILIEYSGGTDNQGLDLSSRIPAGTLGIDRFGGICGGRSNPTIPLPIRGISTKKVHPEGP